MNPCSCRMFLYLFACGLALSISGHAAETNVAPAAPLVLLENDVLRAEITPEKGAALVALVAKATGVELVTEAAWVDSLAFADKTIVSLSNTPFKVVGTAGKDQLELAGSPVVDPATSPLPASFDALKIVKRYRLPAGAAALGVEYELSNTGPAPLELCLVTRLALAGGAGKAQVAVPTSSGAVTFPEKTGVLPIGGRPQGYLYDTDGAWAAVLPDKSDGVLAAIEPRHLSYIRVDAATRQFEFGRTVVTLAPQQIFRTSGWIMPVQGFKRMSGAASELAAAFTVTPAEADGSPPLAHPEFRDRLKKAIGAADATAADDLLSQLATDAGEKNLYKGPPLKIQLQLLAAQSHDVNVSWSWRQNPRGEWQPLAPEKAKLQAGQVALLTQNFSPKKKGTYVVRAEIREGDKNIAAFEQPVIAGSGTGFYQATPPARDGKIDEAFRPLIWVPSTEVKKPHVTLAAPLSAGPVLLLMATPYLCSRGAVEIQHRLDVVMDYVVAGHFYNKSEPATTGRMIKSTLRAQANETLKLRECLNRPHEVIVLAVVDADYFPIDVMDEIFRQVEEDGVGLILFNCGNTLDIMSPFLNTVKKTKGPETAPPLLPAFPQMTTGVFGKGRVALVEGYKSLARPDWYGQSETEVQGLIQAILWAARGLPPVTLTATMPAKNADPAAGAAQPFTVTVHNRGKAPLNGKVRLQVRRDLLRAYPSIYSADNEFAYRPIITWEEAVPAMESMVTAAADGQAQAAFTLPFLTAGAYDLDLQALDDKGATLAFQRRPLTLAGKAKILAADLSTEPAGRTLHVDFSQGSQPWFGARAGDTLKCVAVAGNAGDAVQARLQAFDPWGRMPFDQKAGIKNEGGKAVASFTQPLHACLHMISVLRLSLLDAGGNTLAEQRLLNFIYPRADYLPAFELRGYAEVRVNNDVSGYDVRVGGESALTLAWHGIRKSNYGGVIGASKILLPGDRVTLTPVLSDDLGTDRSAAAAPAEKVIGAEESDIAGPGEARINPRKGYFRVPCFLNPKDREEILDAIKNSYVENSACYPFKGFLTDEFWYSKEDDPKNTISNFRRAFVPEKEMNICRCMHCAKAFCAYARKRFREDLPGLNAAWGTSFKKWEDVEIPLVITNNAAPPPQAMWPYVLAHREFIEDQVAGLVADISRTAKAVHPECESGMSGVWKTSIHNGVDIYRLAGLVTYNMLYSSIDMWTDFGDSDAVNWTGYSAKYAPFMGSATAWRGLVGGLTGIGYYGKETDPMHKADFTFYEEPAYLFREIREIKDNGLDKLVVRHRYRDAIALYYSPRDVSVAQLEDWLENPPRFIAGMSNAGRSYGEFVFSVINSYRQLCNTRYLQPFWTAYAHLDEGHFGKKYGTPRLLLLPYAQCLSTKQAETLRRFVSDGGVLVGDVHTAWRDEHGCLMPKGALDDVFGVSRQGEYRMRCRVDTKAAPISVCFGKEFGESFSLAFDAVGPGDIKPASAKALASFTVNGQEQPAFLVNDFGKGKAVYLNFIPAGYTSVEVAGEGEMQTTQEIAGKAAARFQRMFDKLMDIAQVQPPLEFTSPSRLDVGRFGEGDLSYLGVMAGRSAEALKTDYRVKIKEKRHVYSARLREYLGFTDNFPVRLKLEPRLMGDIYSLLPYKVEGLAAELKAKTVKAGERLMFTVKVLPAVAQQHRHVIAVRAIDPLKQDLTWYRHSIETAAGMATGAIDTAANDTPGAWTLRLTDAATGIQQEIPFEIQTP